LTHHQCVTDSLGRATKMDLIDKAYVLQLRPRDTTVTKALLAVMLHQPMSTHQGSSSLPRRRFGICWAVFTGRSAFMTQPNQRCVITAGKMML